MARKASKKGAKRGAQRKGGRGHTACDWSEAERLYVEEGYSQRAVAEAMGVGQPTVRAHYDREEWPMLRAEFRARAAEESIHAAAEKLGGATGDVLAEIGSLAGKSLGRIRELLDDEAYLAERATISDLSRLPQLFSRLLMDLSQLELARHGVHQQTQDLLRKVSRVIEGNLPEDDARRVLASIVDALGA